MEDSMDFDPREDTPPPTTEARIPDNLLDLWDAMDSLPSPPLLPFSTDFRPERSPDADLLHFLDDSVEFVPARTANATNNPAFDFDSEMPSIDYSPTSPKYAPSSPSLFSSGNGSPLGPMMEQTAPDDDSTGARDEGNDDFFFMDPFGAPSSPIIRPTGGVSIEEIPLSGAFLHNPHSDDLDPTGDSNCTVPPLPTSSPWPADIIIPPPEPGVDYLSELMNVLGLARERRHELEEDELDFPSNPGTTTPTRPSEAPRYAANNTVPIASEKHFPPPAFNVSLIDGDLLVDPPTHSNNWDHIETRRMADRYDIDWLRKVDRAKRLFILGPCERKESDEPTLPLHVIQRQMNIFSASITLEVLEQYSGSVFRAIKWARESGLTPAQCFPWHPGTVLKYLGSLGGLYRPGTIEKILSALKWWHALHGEELVLPKGLWRRTLRGCTAIAPPPRKIRPGVTMGDMKCVVSKLNVTGPNASSFDIAFKANILDTFHGMARLGETTVERVKDDAKKKGNVTRSGVTFFPATKNTPARATIHIPFDKVAKEKGRDIIIVSQNQDPDLCPLLALQRHCDINNPPDDMGLFSYYEDAARGGQLKQLTKSAVVNYFNKLLALDGRPPINGHSFRFGGATYYITAKVDTDIVKQIGGWRSDSFLRYWRQQSLIAARTMADLKVPTEDGAVVLVQELEGDDNEDEYDESLGPDSPPRSCLLITLPALGPRKRTISTINESASPSSTTATESTSRTAKASSTTSATASHSHKTRSKKSKTT